MLGFHIETNIPPTYSSEFKSSCCFDIMGTSLKIKKLEKDEDEASRILYRDFITPARKSFIIVGEDNMCIAESFEKYIEIIKNFNVYNSDIFIASYPKTGTTWLAEMVWMICNNLDFNGGETIIQKRVPFFEMCGIFDHEEMNKSLGGNNPEFIGDSLGFIKRQEGLRIIKTHLQFSMLPQQIQNNLKSSKIIYIMRNPKDTCISYYHHAKLLEGYRGNFEDFCTLFLSGKVLYGSFWKNVLGYWNRRNSPTLLILTFEEMKKDLCSVIRKVAGFLEKSLTEDQIKILENHLSFEAMKNNKAVNLETIISFRKKQKLVVEGDQFLRSGAMNQFKTEMSAEMNTKFDSWTRENVRGTEFTLYNTV